jgi:hypothetical protein
VAVAPGLELALPGPAELGRSVEAAQMVTARHGGDVFTFEGRLSASPAGLLLVGTDSMGRRALTIEWDGRTLTVERAAWLPDSVRPENVLADIMLLYWPEAALRQGLAGSGASLAAGHNGRSVRKDGAEVITVSYDGDPWTGLAHLRNLAWDYDIEVRSAMVESQ